MNNDDPLSALAPLLRVKPELQEYCRFGGIWAAPHAPLNGASQFHIVINGHCVLDIAGHNPTELGKGDILLLPRGDSHVIRSVSTNGNPNRIVTEFRNAIREKSTPDVPYDAELVCGTLHLDGASENAIIATLPNLVVLRSRKVPLADRLYTLAVCIGDELDTLQPGSEVVAANLATALFVMMLREYLEHSPPVSGLLGLIRQRATSRAALAMLKQPSRPWTLDDLAQLSATSRATLVRSFRKISGLTPLGFLSEVRLNMARQHLVSTDDSIGVIAERVGYQSEAALSRALLRRFGVRPSKLRLAGKCKA